MIRFIVAAAIAVFSLTANAGKTVTCWYVQNGNTIDIIEITRGDGAPFIVNIDQCTVPDNKCRNQGTITHTIGTVNYTSADKTKEYNCRPSNGTFNK